MRTIFTHPDKSKTLTVTLVPNTLEGIKAEDGSWSTKVVVVTENPLKLPCVIPTSIGKLTLESVYSKGVKSLTVPVLSTDKEGKQHGTAVVASIIPTTVEAFMLLLNARIFGVYEFVKYSNEQRTVATPLEQLIPAMVNAGSIQLNATPEQPPKADDLPF